MNSPPIPATGKTLLFCLSFAALCSPTLQAQVGGDSETLFSFLGTAPYDNLGRAVAGGGDVNGDGTPDIIIGAPETNVGYGFAQGSVYVFSGVDGTPIYQWNGQSPVHYLFGERVANAGDLNADGFDDVLVTATHASPGGISHAGSVFAYSGANGTLLYDWHGTSSWEGFGNSIAGVGDVNADGFDDLIIGSPEANSATLNNVGAAFVYSGKDGTLLYRFDGGVGNNGLGVCASGAGDANGDGYADLLVSGSFTHPTGYLTTKSVFVFSGADGSELYRFDGERGNDDFGKSLAPAGDINADGFADMLVGAPQGGGVQKGGSVIVFSGADGTPMYGWKGDTYGAKFGYQVVSAGDSNDDGFDDVLISQFTGEYSSSGESGEVLLYSGADGVLLHRWKTSANRDNFGIAISSAGDINGDGRPDIIIGASYESQYGKLNNGSAFVYSFEPFLKASTNTASAATSTAIQFDFDFPSTAAFYQYQLLLSASGVGPTFYGVDIPLTLDNMMGRSFLGNYPVAVHSNLKGTLDSAGDASGSITLPAGINASLIGTTYHCAAICNAPGQLPAYSSIPLALTITL